MSEHPLTHRKFRCLFDWIHAQNGTLTLIDLGRLLTVLRPDQTPVPLPAGIVVVMDDHETELIAMLTPETPKQRAAGRLQDRKWLDDAEVDSRDAYDPFDEPVKQSGTSAF